VGRGKPPGLYKSRFSGIIGNGAGFKTSWVGNLGFKRKNGEAFPKLQFLGKLAQILEKKRVQTAF
jgi:hypothetical protein